MKLLMSNPTNNLSKNTGFLLSWVAAQATNHYETTLQQLGFSAHHVGVLELVNAQQPIIQSRIAEQLDIFKPIIVTLVNELEAKGLVKRRPHPQDKRALEIHLLPKGAKTLDQIRQASTASLAQFLAPLSTAEQQSFHQSLEKLANDNQ